MMNHRGSRSNREQHHQRWHILLHLSLPGRLAPAMAIGRPLLVKALVYAKVIKRALALNMALTASALAMVLVFTFVPSVAGMVTELSILVA